MGYRRDGKQKHDWDRWLADNREALLASGVPGEIYRDQLRFTHAVSHEHDWDYGWHLGLLTPAEAGTLHRLLVEQRDALEFIGVDGMIRSLEAQFRVCAETADKPRDRCCRGGGRRSPGRSGG